jgi:hypothetical protein
MQGTAWTARNEGSTVGDLYDAFMSRDCMIDLPSKAIDKLIAADNRQTNLALTSAAITSYDVARLASPDFHIGK